MSEKKTIVLGASPEKNRFAHKAVKSLIRYGHPVIPIGIKPGNILGVDIVTTPKVYDNIHTVSIYLSPENQKQYYDYILNKIIPKRIIFNPGSENHEFIKMLMTENIEVLIGCTLIMLNTGKF